MRITVTYILLLFSIHAFSQIQSTLRRTQDELFNLYPEGTVSCLPDGSLTEIVDVVNPTTGQIWMDRNLGAQRAATSSTDALAYGDLYQWGRFSDGHQCRNSSITTTNATTYLANDPSAAWYGRFITEDTSPYDWLFFQNDDLWQGNEGVNNPCPSGYRVPTDSELNAERLSWSANNSAGAYGSPLKLTVGGRRKVNDGLFLYVYSGGAYWSSTTGGGSSRYLYFGAGEGALTGSGRGVGMSIRCIKDNQYAYKPNTVHCADTAEVNPIVSETGRVWMDRNLGAAQVATAYNDANSYGDLYQWGRFADGHQCRTSGTTTTLATTSEPFTGGAWDSLFITNGVSPYDWLSTQDDDLWQIGTEINNPCPDEFRVPTEAEWQAELSTWSSLDYNGAFGSKLKLPAAGRRSLTSGSLDNLGSHGYYWSSPVSGSNAIGLGSGSSFAILGTYFRAYGLSIRCIQKYPPNYQTYSYQCDPNKETEVVDVVSPTGKTWMDRNLGASRVAQSSTDSESYGDLYQWGRFADGHQCRDSDTTSVNATTSDPYTNENWRGKFILEPNSPYDWLVPQDDNLWQGVDGKNNPCPQGYRVPTESELNNERLSWSSNNSAGAFASPLKLPVAGYRYFSSGALALVGSYGFYWSSSVSGSNARNLYFNSGGANLLSYLRALGHSVRCIKD